MVTINERERTSVVSVGISSSTFHCSYGNCQYRLFTPLSLPSHHPTTRTRIPPNPSPTHHPHNQRKPLPPVTSVTSCKCLPEWSNATPRRGANSPTTCSSLSVPLNSLNLKSLPSKFRPRNKLSVTLEFSVCPNKGWHVLFSWLEKDYGEDTYFKYIISYEIQL